MGRKVWLEVASNGPWSRERQPNMPISVDEIVDDAVECVRRGAAIVHVHAYDVETGRQKDDPELYIRIFEGIRSKVDAILYPTVPFAQSSGGPGHAEFDRFEVIRVLGARGLLEWSVADMGSLNFIETKRARSDDSAFLHSNNLSEIKINLSLAEKYQFHPSVTIYEPGFLRLCAALYREWPSLPEPIYRFMFSTQYTFGLPPSAWSISIYAKLMKQLHPGCPWMAAGLGVDLSTLSAEIMHAGGHLRVGLEDLPFRSEARNPELTSEAVDAIRNAGHAPASAAEIRAELVASLRPRQAVSQAS